MEYKLKSEAADDLSRLPKYIQERIKAKLDFYISSGDPMHFATRLTDFEIGDYKFRIGDFRAIFEVKEGIVEILRIGNRKDIYR
jgi:mRNA-degrading endonuclease RelE of RelBE toxin-antitoxin system